MRFLLVPLILIDQITKALSAHRDFFFSGIHFHPVRNFHLPLGIDLGWGWNLAASVILYLGIAWAAAGWGAESAPARWGRAMIWAGASSNLADRLLLGYVRDFIDLNLGFVFNLADAFIVCGILLVLFSGRRNPRSVEQINSLPAQKE